MRVQSARLCISVFVAVICLHFGVRDAVADSTVFPDLNSLGHGEIVTTQFSASDGLTIEAFNIKDAVAASAIGYDSRLRGTLESDFEGPNGSDAVVWSGGNLPSTTNLGVLLTIAKDETDVAPPLGGVDFPEDLNKKSRITFKFSTPVKSFGLDFVDVSDSEANEANSFFSGFYLGTRVIKTHFVDLAGYPSFGAPDFGSHTANRFKPITAASAGVPFFTKVIIKFAKGSTKHRARTSA